MKYPLMASFCVCVEFEPSRVYFDDIEADTKEDACAEALRLARSARYAPDPIIVSCEEVE